MIVRSFTKHRVARINQDLEPPPGAGAKDLSHVQDWKRETSVHDQITSRVRTPGQLDANKPTSVEGSLLFLTPGRQASRQGAESLSSLPTQIRITMSTALGPKALELASESASRSTTLLGCLHERHAGTSMTEPRGSSDPKSLKARASGLTKEREQVAQRIKNVDDQLAMLALPKEAAVPSSRVMSRESLPQSPAINRDKKAFFLS